MRSCALRALLRATPAMKMRTKDMTIHQRWVWRKDGQAWMVA